MLDVGTNNAELRNDPLYLGLRISRIRAHEYFELVDELINEALVAEGLSRDEAVRRLWFVDLYGLVVKERTAELLPHNLPYAHDHPRADFLNAIDSVRPNVLIGATGAAGSFTQGAIERMARCNERPAILALSNPTSRAECTAEQAYRWSGGRAVFASGSPFDAVKLGEQTLRPSQSNNAYIFPGIGLGATFCRTTTVTDTMFLVAAKTLAAAVTPNEIERGALYPPLRDVRTISVSIAAAVAQVAYDAGLARTPRPPNLEQAIQESMYDPRY
jgi:malate dehydrogenase (oxaloacetate-decarboxylating)(NADP+)